MTAGALEADVMGALGDILGRNPPTPSGFLTSAWSTDPYARGAYSFVTRQCRPSDFAVLAQPIAGKVLLTGEHTDFAWHGTVHGACLAGRRTADQVAKLAHAG